PCLGRGLTRPLPRVPLPLRLLRVTWVHIGINEFEQQAILLYSEESHHQDKYSIKQAKHMTKKSVNKRKAEKLQQAAEENADLRRQLAAALAKANPGARGTPAARVSAARPGGAAASSAPAGVPASFPSAGVAVSSPSPAPPAHSSSEAANSSSAASGSPPPPAPEQEEKEGDEESEDDSSS
ncbi:unnamed protein product, partial [Pylaiella littoralis]